ncbi:hypothetical protein ANOM_003256 [Aspergillus nomiae NRRL 13137]|uniref:Cellulose-binding protein n=1 Tax=Aspergillus nomiae NRRL (strain ATCC 15546 / NRRL 13137 / CBS 260.88 / M93) TaxID=1509407 RepID=A0A0L1JAR0_ASPN3|nr:uncharacterized protein ANOM_003256 [Aspergillus nomiae NRRL 13137]KNG88493.1 hypothetical protein ANOM_003256 [Aspergillus nomiae NRRL 13137]
MAEPTTLRLCENRPRVFILSDISNEPDDDESLVRYLLYSNEFDTRGIVACTSCWLRQKISPESMERIVHAYAKVVDNLNAHVHPSNPYPSPEYLLSIIKSGPPVYGRAALAPGVPLSSGAELLVEQLKASEEPLWVISWGGANVLAQALQHIHQTCSATESAALRSRLRVYTISDQDDTGMWIRVTYPDIFYICSVHAWKEYGMAAWIGISGDALVPFDEGGPDVTKVKKEWLREHIQIGPLGQAYPTYSFIMEGDTPTFLYLIQNGLGSPEHPEWGSWGGRYALSDIGGASKHYADARDTVVGKDGKSHTSNQATIWRWRDHFQDDFAARMQWSLGSDRSKANHAPVAIVNESNAGPDPLFLESVAGSEVLLDASQSYDPDGDELTFTWFFYKEVTSSQQDIQWIVPDLQWDVFEDAQKPRGSVIRVKIPPPAECAVDLVNGQAVGKGQAFHLILQLQDDGVPRMTTYKRVILQMTNPELLGGTGKVFSTFTEVVESRGDI